MKVTICDVCGSAIDIMDKNKKEPSHPFRDASSAIDILIESKGDVCKECFIDKSIEALEQTIIKLQNKQTK